MWGKHSLGSRTHKSWSSWSHDTVADGQNEWQFGDLKIFIVMVSWHRQVCMMFVIKTFEIVCGGQWPYVVCSGAVP